MMRPNDIFTASYYGDIKKVKELLAQEPVEDEPPFDEEFDPLAPVDDEAEAAAKERAEKRREFNAELFRRLSQNGTTVTRLSVVNTTEYGLGTTLTEKGLKVSVQFKPSAADKYAASPLHWAVLGREHDVVRYLVEQGANVDAQSPELDVTVKQIIEANQSWETQRALEQGIELRKAKVDAETAKWSKYQAEVDRRAEARKVAQEEVRKKEEEEKRQQEEEEAAARAAEEAAAAEAAGDAPADDGADDE